MTDLENLRRIIDNWYKRAKGQKIKLPFDEFDSFISLWIAFNSWGYYETNRDIDKEMIASLKENVKIKSAFEESKKEDYFIERLSEMIGVKIPTHRFKKPYVWISDENSLGDILDVIYAIRCNLFHGRKNPIDKTDSYLVTWAGFILDRIFVKLKNRSDFLHE